jgi:hypothetical protein
VLYTDTLLLAQGGMNPSLNKGDNVTVEFYGNQTPVGGNANWQDNWDSTTFSLCAN